MKQGHIESILQPPPLPGAAPYSGLPQPPLMASSVEDSYANANASDIARSVVDQVLARDEHGQRKYGVSLDRTDLSTADWLQHMAEEMMDGAHYALAAKREADRREQAQREAVTKAMNSTQGTARSLLSPEEYKCVERALGVFWKLYQSEVSK